MPAVILYLYHWATAARPGYEERKCARTALSCSYNVTQAYSMLSLLPYATRGLLATDYVILDHGQVTWTTLEDVSALDRFNVHRFSTWRVFSVVLDSNSRQGKPISIPIPRRYLYHTATAAHQ
ncbi:hypothetical protein TNCV_381691 [Trichonephila clavipes]|uniref:Uncharacterized protein n=1 Tax=Trichonephila clavipes TaxID=2585209 RepID=A0A8X6SEC3_TRICX|nr:hypothetical protein TNCV_381691 [Trichonephila clavipes]